MKIAIKKVIILFLAVFALASCTKDDEHCDPNNEESPCYAGSSDGMLLLVEEKQSDFTYKYTYDERNRMIRWDISVSDGSGSWHFTYDADDRLVALDRRDESGTFILRDTYTYGSDNRPISGTSGPPNNENIVQIQFVYAQNTIIETHSIEGEIGNVFTYTYDDRDNLLSLQNQSANESSNFLFEFGDYDDKPYPHQKFPSYRVPASINNYQSYRSTTANGVQDHRYEYIYNESGYPVKAKIYDRQTGVLVATREYTYKKAN